MRPDLTRELGALLAFSGAVATAMRTICWTGDHDPRTLAAGNKVLSEWSDSLHNLALLGADLMAWAEDPEAARGRVIAMCGTLRHAFERSERSDCLDSEARSFSWAQGIQILASIVRKLEEPAIERLPAA
ncbi:hypothetical protein LAZ40_11105 [Cereibacter sphaeroides]|uniref:hypothetical protein n=1 Tax=Cereibacter sphaeroides TaxID=1063 RepID=UPI001F15A595|nr:hypothetical protein [Cereibacter sphaeroides]MCE6959603.1 hypothetical protein [Cereibacter sphaeroides]MCE6974537.1 hypothetical protein [Cereibacter sphaeroides]